MIGNSCQCGFSSSIVNAYSSGLLVHQYYSERKLQYSSSMALHVCLWTKVGKCTPMLIPRDSMLSLISLLPLAALGYCLLHVWQYYIRYRRITAKIDQFPGLPTKFFFGNMHQVGMYSHLTVFYTEHCINVCDTIRHWQEVVVGVQRAASPWRTLGTRSCWNILFRLGLIANALTQCSS